MASDKRKHSGRKRPTGELKMLNLRKFEKMLRLAGDGGFDAQAHIDSRYYPKIQPHKPAHQKAPANAKKEFLDRAGGENVTWADSE